MIARGKKNNYEYANSRRKQGRMFENNPKIFYCELVKQKQKVSSPPEKDGLQPFWKGNYEDGKEHNKETEWIANREKKKHHLQEMLSVRMDAEKIR